MVSTDVVSYPDRCTFWLANGYTPVNKSLKKVSSGIDCMIWNLKDSSYGPGLVKSLSSRLCRGLDEDFLRKNPRLEL